MSDRPWYRLHATTWLAIAVVGLTMVWANWHVRFDGITAWQQGWPTTARMERSRNNPLRYPVSFGAPRNIARWQAIEFGINTAAFLLILASIAFACERWRRRGVLPWQFSIGFMLATITVVAILWWLHGHADSLAKQWTSETGLLSFLPRYDYYNWLEEFPWLASAPLVFGECCLVYAVAVYVVKGAQWLAKASQPRAWYRPHLSSLVAGAVVAAAVLQANGELRTGEFLFHSRSYQGWPANFRMFWEEYRADEESVGFTFYETFGTDFVWRWGAVDLGVGLLLILGTVTAWELVRRRGLKAQLHLRTALIVLAIAALLWAIHANADRLYAACTGDQDVFFWRQHPLQEPAWTRFALAFGRSETGRVFVSYPWQYPFPWYVVGPIFFAQGCVLYAVSWLLAAAHGYFPTVPSKTWIS